MLSPFLFAVVVDVVTELAGDGMLSELLYADDIVQMNIILVFESMYIFKRFHHCIMLLLKPKHFLSCCTEKYIYISMLVHISHTHIYI